MQAADLHAAFTHSSKPMQQQPAAAAQHAGARPPQHSNSLGTVCRLTVTSCGTLHQQKRLLQQFHVLCSNIYSACLCSCS
jgi:hypothetical protein